MATLPQPIDLISQRNQWRDDIAVGAIPALALVGGIGGLFLLWGILECVTGKSDHLAGGILLLTVAVGLLWVGAYTWRAARRARKALRAAYLQHPKHVWLHDTYRLGEQTVCFQIDVGHDNQTNVCLMLNRYRWQQGRWAKRETLQHIWVDATDEAQLQQAHQQYTKLAEQYAAADAEHQAQQQAIIAVHADDTRRTARQLAITAADDTI